jgi:D-alanyl-D-alanine carboxypeptidase
MRKGEIRRFRRCGVAGHALSALQAITFLGFLPARALGEQRIFEFGRVPMPESSFNHPLFGKVRFRTLHDVWIRGDGIQFISGFDTDDITQVTIPQLKHVPGSHGGKLRFHKRAHSQLLMAFADIERLNLLKHIRTCAGSLNFRLRKPTSGALSKLPSNHVFGIAIDLNADDGSNGGSVAPVAPVFEALGFTWGISFNDPMHFEVDEFIEDPDSVSPHLAALAK